MNHEDDAEDLAQLIRLIEGDYDVSQSEIARRIGVSVSTVNTWAHRKRGRGRGPNPDTLRRLAAEFPRFSEERVFAAAGRKRPGPLSPDAEERVLEMFRRLTAEQQKITLAQMGALDEMNRTTLS
ncbi:winged helix-turn-helix transcriptional regulator [Streptomyces triculaminicus]|uniref:winged helix-turn-helix transcriptional regulator n=1 Tax=Streptomyces triculaminicus TaxID=2816232 RepID=UPI0037A96DBA